MAEPPRVPPDPDDETVVVPPTEDWGPESEVFVEESVTEPPPPKRPVLWPWLLALLVLVLAGLGAAYFLTRDDDDAATTTASTATTAPTTTTVASATVPDVVGTTSSEATKTLRDAGFEVNVVAVPSDRPSGQVVAQSPAAGSEADKGSSVRLNVAQKAAQTTTAATTEATTTTETSTAPTTTTPTPQPATVPDVVGQELADAAREFNDEGLKVAVKYVPSQEPRGQVIAQAQPAGTERQEGDTVQLNTSTGPDPPEQAAVPDVAGTKQSPARTQLSAAGFEVLTLQQRTEDRSRVGSVLSQTPSGGANIPRGSLVILYVGA